MGYRISVLLPKIQCSDCCLLMLVLCFHAEARIKNMCNSDKVSAKKRSTIIILNFFEFFPLIILDCRLCILMFVKMMGKISWNLFCALLIHENIRIVYEIFQTRTFTAFVNSCLFSGGRGLQKKFYFVTI